eukprot:706260-Pelagomonas_calceolata.AAC.1
MAPQMKQKKSLKPNHSYLENKINPGTSACFMKSLRSDELLGGAEGKVTSLYPPTRAAERKHRSLSGGSALKYCYSSLLFVSDEPAAVVAVHLSTATVHYISPSSPYEIISWMIPGAS